LLLVLAAGGCALRQKMTLRDAEDLGRLWVADLMAVLAPPPEAASKASGDGEDASEQEEPPRSPNPKMAVLVAPETLRDCFVSNGWKPDGFKNPTAAMCWLTGQKLRRVEITSIEQVEKGAEVTFQVAAAGAKPQALVARVVIEDSTARCTSLVQQTGGGK
jgi:hypothetical protein